MTKAMTNAQDDDEMPLKLEPLKVKCGDTACEKGFHCFRPNRRKKVVDYSGACIKCGVKRVDFERVRQRDLEDADHTFEALQHELIRHVFFSAPFDKKALEHAKKLGMERLKARARSQLQTRIGKVPTDWDGQQTKKHSNALRFAQHATATCCRKCLDYWYGVPRDRALKKEELDFCEGLVLKYLDRRADDLFPEATSTAPAESSHAVEERDVVDTASAHGDRESP